MFVYNFSTWVEDGTKKLTGGGFYGYRFLFPFVVLPRWKELVLKKSISSQGYGNRFSDYYVYLSTLCEKVVNSVPVQLDN